MSDSKYQSLKSELLAIRDIVHQFDENLRPFVLEALLGAFQSPSTKTPQSHHANEPDSNSPQKLKPIGQEIPGIALINPEGKLELSVRDFKASSANNAAKRLAYIAIRAQEKLSGETSISSKGTMVPLLREHRIYNGNTRNTLANDHGIRRNGDLLSLDTPGKTQADKFMSEILDEAVEGNWSPNAVRKKRSKKILSE